MANVATARQKNAIKTLLECIVLKRAAELNGRLLLDGSCFESLDEGCDDPPWPQSNPFIVKIRKRESWVKEGSRQ